jgi:hypothetical protein
MRQLLALLLLIALARGSAAADLGRVDRSLGKEPAYDGRPRYCLLVFGPEVRTRVWVVLAGDALYVDFNGDGDLTRPGERLKPARVRANPRPGAALVHSFLEVVPPNARPELNLPAFRDGRQGRTWFFLEHYLPAKGAGKDQIRVGFLIDGQFGQVGQAVPADNRQDAPVLHFAGPLTLRLAEEAVLRPGEKVDFQVQVVTPGLGAGAVTILDSACIPADAHPVGDIEFPARPPLTARVVFRQRCCGDRIHGTLRIPDAAGAGRVKVILTLSDWKEGRVAPATGALAVSRPRSPP